MVQDIFLTETARLADVVFPVTSFAESQGTQVNNGGQCSLSACNPAARTGETGLDGRQFAGAAHGN